MGQFPSLSHSSLSPSLQEAPLLLRTRDRIFSLFFLFFFLRDRLQAIISGRENVYVNILCVDELEYRGIGKLKDVGLKRGQLAIRLR